MLEYYHYYALTSHQPSHVQGCRRNRESLGKQMGDPLRDRGPACTWAGPPHTASPSPPCSARSPSRSRQGPPWPNRHEQSRTKSSVGDPMTFWCGSGSSDLYLWLMDPDPTSDPTCFFDDFKDAKRIFFHILFLQLAHRNIIFLLKNLKFS